MKKILENKTFKIISTNINYDYIITISKFIARFFTIANIYVHLEKDTKNKSANVLSNTLTLADI